MEYDRVWCPLGLKSMYNCISAAKMPTIKTLTGVPYMPPTPKPVQFHVGIHRNEANDVTYTSSRQQSGETMEEIWSNRTYVALALFSLLATCVVRCVVF
jgi:hypothetical protein